MATIRRYALQHITANRCHTSIYPPLTRNRHGILAAAAPVVQQPPEIHHEPAGRGGRC
jgi:hypothetical protein